MTKGRLKYIADEWWLQLFERGGSAELGSIWSILPRKDWQVVAFQGFGLLRMRRGGTVKAGWQVRTDMAWRPLILSRVGFRHTWASAQKDKNRIPHVATFVANSHMARWLFWPCSAILPLQCCRFAIEISRITCCHIFAGKIHLFKRWLSVVKKNTFYD